MRFIECRIGDQHWAGRWDEASGAIQLRSSRANRLFDYATGHCSSTDRRVRATVVLHDGTQVRLTGVFSSKVSLLLETTSSNHNSLQVSGVVRRETGRMMLRVLGSTAKAELDVSFTANHATGLLLLSDAAAQPVHVSFS